MAVGTILIKSIKWLLALAFALPVAAYLFLLVINWSDRPPSAAAIEFQRALEKRPRISDSDNAYVYMMGFDIARDLDPVERGRRRIDWIDSISGNPGENHYDNPPGEYTSIRKARSQPIQNLASACWQSQGAECAEALVNGEKLLDDGYAGYASYPPRVADLEGVRRAALLAALLRSRAVALEPRQMQRLLDQSSLRNPYNGEPFAWDDEAGAIVFIGLEFGERGLHTFLY